jgi:hypothetical protein
VSLARFSIEPVGMDCNVTEKMQRMSGGTGLGRKEFDRARAQVSSFIQLAE